MSIESTPKGEFLNVSAFLERSLGKLGVTAVTELQPVDRAKILFAFHIERCERDATEWLPQYNVPESQSAQVAELLAARGGELTALAEQLIGYTHQAGDFDDVAMLWSD